MRVETFEPEHLPHLLDLINTHLSAVVPGWSLTAEFLKTHLKRDTTEPVTDPWVIERTTLCATGEDGMRAAAHLLRYGDGVEVGEALRGAGEINWIVSRPEYPDAASAVLSAAREWLAVRNIDRVEVWGGGMFVPVFCGVPDSWPHVVSALETAGYRPGPERREALYGGSLDGVPEPEGPAVPNLKLRRSPGALGTRFSAMLGAREVGFCEIVPDLTRDNALPALRGWAELAELRVEEGWRGRGIGAWIVHRAVAELRTAGGEHIVFCVAAADETAGAGRFYRRFGWDVLVRETRSWTRRQPTS